MKKEEILSGNKLIAIFMGLKFIPSEETSSPTNFPNGVWWDDKKRIGFPSLNYDTDWNWLMEVVEKINTTHNQENPYRDLLYTMQYLLGGGYRFSEIIFPRLLFSHENLWKRVVAFIEYNH